MNPKQTLVVLGTAALCGIALAQAPKTKTPAERLDVLEAQVQSLDKQLAASKLAAADECAALKKELADTRELANRIATWAQAQNVGAAALTRVLDDSEAKGFTFGINPDSRVVLLEGWRSFTAGLQKDVPLPLVDKAAPAPDAKPGTPKRP